MAPPIFLKTYFRPPLGNFLDEGEGEGGGRDEWLSHMLERPTSRKEERALHKSNTCIAPFHISRQATVKLNAHLGGGGGGGQYKETGDEMRAEPDTLQPAASEDDKVN